MNYEVLQTCGLTEEEFQSLLRENLKQYAMLRVDEETRLAWLSGGVENPGQPEDEENGEDEEGDFQTTEESDSSAFPE